jgi:replication factor A1
MRIIDLQIGQQKVSVEEAELVKKGGVREVVMKAGKRLHVSNSVIQDASGTIGISIWDADIEKVKEGDRVRVTDVAVKDFHGKPSINLVKGSTIEVIT